MSLWEYKDISFLKEKKGILHRVVKNQNENALEKETRKEGIRKKLRYYLRISTSSSYTNGETSHREQ